MQKYILHSWPVTIIKSNSLSIAVINLIAVVAQDQKLFYNYLFNYIRWQLSKKWIHIPFNIDLETCDNNFLFSKKNLFYKVSKFSFYLIYESGQFCNLYFCNCISTILFYSLTYVKFFKRFSMLQSHTMPNIFSTIFVFIFDTCQEFFRGFSKPLLWCQ